MKLLPVRFLLLAATATIPALCQSSTTSNLVANGGATATSATTASPTATAKPAEASAPPVTTGALRSDIANQDRVIKNQIDAQQNLLAVRAAMKEALDEQTPHTELESLRLALQKLSYDADVVLDLHCDFEGALHLYTNPDLWADVGPLARYLEAKASLFALNSDGNPFDEIHSFCWSALRERYGDRFPIPNGAVSVTIELRGQADVSYDFAERDANAIVNYLTHRGVIEGTPAPLPPLEYAATPFAGAEALIAPVSGVLVFRTPVGVKVEPGQPIADVVDPLTDRVVTITSSVTGMLYARQRTRFATAGMEVAWVAGATPLRSGSLLPD